MSHFGNLAFDATTVAPDNPLEPLPAGDYRAMVVASDVKPNKKGTGSYLQLTWQVLDGAYAGRKVFDRLNIVNENAQAQEIGQRQLSAVCHAVGVLKVTDSSQLHDKPAVIRLVVKQDPGYEARNEVKKYLTASGAAPGASLGASGGAPAAPGRSASSPATLPPWERPSAAA